MVPMIGVEIKDVKKLKLTNYHLDIKVCVIALVNYIFI